MSFKPTMSLKEALDIIGNFSKPGKMPWYGYSTSAELCNTGQKLAEVVGSVCHGCYAKRGNYRYKNVNNALRRRHDTVITNPMWLKAMTNAIYIQNIIDGGTYFRWHDSGDITSVRHLRYIVKIAEMLPHINFWLPTRESVILSTYVKKYGNNWPSNLTIRLSANMIGKKVPESILTKLNVNSSSVVEDDSYNCEAKANKAIFGKNTCGTCRKCWSKDILDVSYPKH